MRMDLKRLCPRCGHELDAAGYSRKLRRHQDTGECRATLTRRVRETVLAARGFVPGVGLYRGSFVLDALDAILPECDRSVVPHPGELQVWVKQWVAAVYDAVRHTPAGVLAVTPETFYGRHHAVVGVASVVKAVASGARAQEDVCHINVLGGPPAVRAWLIAHGHIDSSAGEEPLR